MSGQARSGAPTGAGRPRSWWGWGYEDGGLSREESSRLAGALGERFGVDGELKNVPSLESLELAAPRIAPPPSLGVPFRTDVAARASHTYGKSYRDVVRALAGLLEHPPDLVMYPRNEADVVDVLDWCGSAGVAVVPFGGGSSVVGGVEAAVGDSYAGSVSLDLGALGTVLDVDAASRAARIEAGTFGPSLEDQLRPHGLTLRHFPQSFEFSSLGGWIATRSGGHFATGPTHIDDLVESTRLVTPSGILETRRLPASGAGPSPDRLVLGSEGILGVVTEAWVRVRPRARWRAGGTARFTTFSEGARCVRSLAQCGLEPSNCRLIDPLEALVNGAGDGSAALLFLGFESADHPLGAWSSRAVELVNDHGGDIDTETWRSGDEPLDALAAPGLGGTDEPGSSGAWRSAFLRAPYLRDSLVRLGVMCETFETAVTWDRFDELCSVVRTAVSGVLEAWGAGAGFVTCRTTHAYPDGAAPYFTVVAPARGGSELDQWSDVKSAASEALLAAGGTITHHHAVGRDHRPWYDVQRPALFASALRAAKDALDPAGILNPGVLLSP